MKSIHLAEHIKRFVGLNPVEEQKLQKHSKHAFLDESDFLLEKGQACDSLFFVKSGCLRMYFTDGLCQEQTIQFAIEGWWITDYTSFIKNLPSDYYIQATEKAEIIILDKNNYEILIREIPQLLAYFNQIMQINLAATQTKNKYMNSMTKEELLQLFCKSFPEFIERVPLIMVVSYLGILGHK
ncbi:Crp/Fnr family transcriptional regulator [Sunxiuqinia sp. A32]|uniref:Crp/Fnr family transcriptional regulator n=1 Tax=Sunxiuqinia sp. A32 TaxID=3461496 RepID=UPI004045D919